MYIHVIIKKRRTLAYHGSMPIKTPSRISFVPVISEALCSTKILCVCVGIRLYTYIHVVVLSLCLYTGCRGIPLPAPFRTQTAAKSFRARDARHMQHHRMLVHVTCAASSSCACACVYTQMHVCLSISSTSGRDFSELVSLLMLSVGSACVFTCTCDFS